MPGRDATGAGLLAACTAGALFVAAFLALTLAPQAQGARFIAGNDSGQLAYFESSNPKRFIRLDVSGLDNATEDFTGLDVRPKTGNLWALTQSFPALEYRVYRARIDLGERSAELTRLAGPFTIPGVNDNNLGFAFDPVHDEMRIIEHDSDANRTIDATTFGIDQDAPLAYATGDPSFGQNPGAHAIGYTNQRAGAERTKLYGIDEFPDSLVRVRPPTEGVLHTVGPLDVNTTYGFHFDIAPGGDAFALLRKLGDPRLFRVNLRTGHASGLGQVGKRNESGNIPEYGLPFSFALVSKRLVR